MAFKQLTIALCAGGALSAGAITAMSQSHDAKKGHAAGGAAHWDYKDPASWGKTDATDKQQNSLCVLGKNQTPIDIVPGAVNSASKLRALEIGYSSKQAKLRNNGHTIQVDYVVKRDGEGWPKQKSGHTLKTDDGVFDLKQFHFHAPSENKIGGVGYAMEGHLVHYSDAGAPAVLAVMFEVAASPNAKLAPIWKGLPATGKAPAVDVSFNPEDLLPAANSRSYYSFDGSLTTPPCSETVRWYVLKTPVGVSQAQVDAFKATIPKIAGLNYVSNARPLQPLKARDIKEFKP